MLRNRTHRARSSVVPRAAAQCKSSVSGTSISRRGQPTQPYANTAWRTWTVAELMLKRNSQPTKSQRHREGEPTRYGPSLLQNSMHPCFNAEINFCQSEPTHHSPLKTADPPSVYPIHHCTAPFPNYLGEPFPIAGPHTTSTGLLEPGP